MMLLVLCALIASRLSVTKAGSLSNTMGAERLTGKENSDTMTLSPRLMPAPSLALINVTGMNITS